MAAPLPMMAARAITTIDECVSLRSRSIVVMALAAIMGRGKGHFLNEEVAISQLMLYPLARGGYSCVCRLKQIRVRIEAHF